VQLELMATPEELVEKAVATIRLFTPQEGIYYGAFSGGKDSTAIKALAVMAGVPVEWHYNATGIDPPELVRYILREHPDVVIDRPKINVFQKCESNGMPTRFHRWCCRHLKEFGGTDRRMLLGIRSAESPRRAKTWGVVTMRRGHKEAISPVIHWSDDMVWWFLRSHEIPYCSLYDEGFHRLGCVGCPMATPGQREAEFARWPHFGRAWRRAADRYFATGRTSFQSADALWRWWMYEEKTADEDDCQGILDLM